MVNISINDEDKSLPRALSLEELLALERLTGPGNRTQQFAVAINGEFVPRSRYREVMVNDGDNLDIVSPVGGG